MECFVKKKHDRKIANVVWYVSSCEKVFVVKVILGNGEAF